MIPKEKAKELVNKFRPYSYSSDGLNSMEREYQIEDNSKQCALIAVDEIIKSEPRYPSDVDWNDVGETHQYYYEAQHEEALNYWQQVKHEIKQL